MQLRWVRSLNYRMNRKGFHAVCRGLRFLRIRLAEHQLAWGTLGAFTSDRA
jgi:hypothetical protein